MNHHTETRDAAIGEMQEILNENPDGLSGDILDRYEILEGEVADANREIKERQVRRDKVREMAANPANVINGDGARDKGPSVPRDLLDRRDPFAPAGYESGTETRSRALSAVEQWNADDEIKESVTDTVERLSGSDVKGVSAHVIRYSDPLYVSAFRKFANDPEGYLADFTPDERRIWQDARDHQRATLQISGAVIPSPLDPMINLTNASAIDPMRQIARVEQTSALTKRFITSAGSTFSFDAELAEVSDDTFTEAEVEINTHKAQGWIEASLEVAMDQPGFSNEVAKVIADGKARLESTMWIDGTGSDQPFGLQVELDGTASELTPATTEVFAAADVYTTLEGVPPRFRANASFMAELSTINLIDQMETTNSAKLFPDLGQSSLLRRPMVENSAADPGSAIDPAVTADNFVLYAGDFSQFVILDRVGLAVQFIPAGFVLNTTANRPDGRVGWYLHWRTGAESLIDDAFRVMNIATTA